jgi:hypothetical protein
VSQDRPVSKELAEKLRGPAPLVVAELTQGPMAAAMLAGQLSPITDPARLLGPGVASEPVAAEETEEAEEL